jgi:purine nucleosidase
MTSRLPILLDTDIGSDIDDAVALSYLLKQPQCELLGITTVTGDVAKRCACAEVVCRAAGREDIPIHAGTSKVLLHGPGQPNVPHYDAIAHLPHKTDWKPNTAIDFLRQTIRSRPGEITLLTIGPFTNIALLFAIDPEIPRLLKRVVSMAGVFYSEEPKAEWNCLVDPIATAMVYSANVADQTTYGLDVTLQCTMPADEVRKRFNNPPLDIVLMMAEAWFKEHDVIRFHDPLPAVGIFTPDVCEYESGTIEIGAQGESKFSSHNDARHRVARTVNVATFFDEYFRVL